MKILIVSSFLPYPLFSGGHVRLYNVIRELSKKHKITLVCEKRTYQTDKDILKLKQLCKQVIVVERKKQWSLQTILHTGFSWYPFLLAGHKLQFMRHEIQTLLAKERFDLIHVETFYVMQNLPQTSIPVVLVEHNIEHVVYSRYAKQAPIFIRPILALDIVKLRYWERFFWRRATKLVAVSQEEKILMGRSDVGIVPNGVDTKKYQISNIKYQISKKEKRILFIGDFRWIQNRDSVEWIIKEIWPSFYASWRIKAGKPKVKLWVVGRKIPDEIKRLTDDQNVIFDEDAPKDTEKIFAQADILLAPIRIGGGTSYKILEAMASGVPVVTTSLGREGIEARDKKEVLIADTAEDIVNAVVSLLGNQKQYKEIAINARRLIEAKYDWKEIVKKLEAVYASVVKNNYI